MAEHFDILIRNISVVDGTGQPSYPGSIGIRNERIAAIGTIEGEAAKIIDGNGLIVCPGFIDSHSHADLSIMDYPLAENLIMQGITTFVGGHCGVTLSPLKDKNYFEELKHAWGFNLEPIWETFGQWLSFVERNGLSLNYAPLVGHNAIRGAVLGSDYKRIAGQAEIEEMAEKVREAMESGAFGLTVGLDANSPGQFADREEMIRLLKIVKEYGGIFSPHTRHHQNQWPSDSRSENAYGLYQGPKGELFVGRYHGLMEAIELAKQAGEVNLFFAHFTPSYNIPQPHPAYLDDAAARATVEEIIDKAGTEGFNIYFSVIPIENSIGSRLPVLSSFFNENLSRPAWLKDLGKEEFTEKLKDKTFAEKVKEFVFSGKFKFGMIHPITDPYWMDCYRILTCRKQEYVGRTIGEIARNRSRDNIQKAVYDDSLAVVFDVLGADPDATWALIRDKREYGALSVFFSHPNSVPMTDVQALPAASKSAKDFFGYGISPAAYGMFPHFLAEFVKRKKILSLEAAVRKLTGIPAREVFHIKDRGLLKEHMFADIVIMDFDKLNAEYDFLKPEQPPEGMKYVIVNGKIVYENMAHTGIRPGKVLRRDINE